MSSTASAADGAPARPDRDEQRRRSHELFEELQRARAASSDPADDPAIRGPRTALVELHLPLAEHLARRFRNRGEAYDDLLQVASLALLNAIDRFDVDRGLEFSTFATPTIIGEIKRHFRDKGWAVRVPRRLQDLRLRLNQATEELSHKLGRSPTVGELAVHLELSPDEVLEVMESANAYTTVSLDGAGEGDDEGASLVDTLGDDDISLDHVVQRESLRPLLDALPARERRILVLRFFHGMTQSEIAEEIGISQMHVSRLLARTLDQLRRELAD